MPDIELDWLLTTVTDPEQSYAELATVTSIGQCNTQTLTLERDVLLMKQRPRIYYTQSQIAQMWDRWQEGVSLNEIGRMFDRGHSSVQRILAETGGIRPPQRRRSRQALSLAEREEISRGIVAGRSLRSIASSLGRAPSTVSRELRRDGGRHRYRADQAAWDRAKRPKSCKLVTNRGAGTGRRQQAAARVGTGSDRWLAEAHVPGQRGHAGVTRDDLHEPVHPGPRGLEERASTVSSQVASDAPFAAQDAQGRRAGPDHQHRIDPRATRGG